MASPGRKPMPVEKAKLLGNPSKRPLPDDSALEVLPAAEEMPEPLRPLEDAGTALWLRVWRAAQVWLSPDTDVELLQITCELLDERQELQAVVRETRDWRDRRALRSIDSQLLSNLSVLGFTPTDHSRLGVARVKAESTLQQMRRERDER